MHDNGGIFMRTSTKRGVLALLLSAALLVAAGCGDDAETSTPAPAPTSREAAPEAATTERPATPEREAATAEDRGTRIVLGDSPFGRMLFNADRQAIYIFENDREDETVCYGECAQAWPPVFTDGEPVAGDGVDASLLGTIERRGGRRQVTYAGKPLYFYVNEGPGEVRCHNVNLNGGLWWVVGPDGRRRA
jgi:predicted lipoprotein with Yx(FWY)xxD motif